MSQKKIAIIGGGPAGLRVAELLTQAGKEVTLFEGQRSAGRKFLIAGKRGLNLTHDEEWALFLKRYQADGEEELPIVWSQILQGFDSKNLRDWAAQLGVETFVASSGKVFPQGMKAAILFSRWLKKLKESGLEIQTKMELKKMTPQAGGAVQLQFLNNQSEERWLSYSTVVLALGGGSWPQTGSTGTWVKGLNELGVKVIPLQASNCGWEVSWSRSFLEEAEGEPLKNIEARVGERVCVGELVITEYGLEGGPLYHLGATLRKEENPLLMIDLKPSFSEDELVRKIESAVPGRENFLSEVSRRWKLSKGQMALLKEYMPKDLKRETLMNLACLIKRMPISLERPRPLQEAISTAGGIAWEELDDSLRLKKYPAIYCVGEMLNWDAPTGGYLLQGAFASGTHVARSILSQENRND